MTTPDNPEHAHRRLDSMLEEMTVSGSRSRRTARRIREAVDALLAEAHGSKVTKMPHLVRPDVPPTTEALAVQLVVHHLQLAWAYWEQVDSQVDLDTALVLAPGERLSLSAERAWLRELDRTYAELDEEEDEHD